MSILVVHQYIDNLTGVGATPIPITVTGLTQHDGVTIFVAYNKDMLTCSPAATGCSFVSDNKNSADPFGDNYTVESFICKDITVAGAVLITFTMGAAGSGNFKYWISEISGQDTGTQPDVAGVSNWQNGSPPAPTSGNFTIVTNGAMVMGHNFVAFAPNTGATAGAGFTLGAVDATQPQYHQGEYKLGVAPGATAATFGNTPGVEVITTAMAIRPAAGATVISQGQVTQPGPGIQPGNAMAQFRRAPRSTDVGFTPAPPIIGTQGFVPQPGPGARAPFNLNQFQSFKYSTDIVPKILLPGAIVGRPVGVQGPGIGPGKNPKGMFHAFKSNSTDVLAPAPPPPISSVGRPLGVQGPGIGPGRPRGMFIPGTHSNSGGTPIPPPSATGRGVSGPYVSRTIPPQVSSPGVSGAGVTRTQNI